jgi:hypothetical protein
MCQHACAEIYIKILVNHDRPVVVFTTAVCLGSFSHLFLPVSQAWMQCLVRNNGVLPMKIIFGFAWLWIVRVALFSWLAAIMSVGSAQASTVSYTLDDVFLVDRTQMTGAFDWTYTIGDFEGGNGVFTALEIPWRPSGTAPPLEQEGMVFTIETNQIEISLDGNFHDYGLDISLKFVQALSPTQSSLIDLNTSFYECCGNGFKDQAFSSGSISPVPIPASVWLFGSGLLGLIGIARRKKA